ncbi:MAG TPA: hypothetical protein VIK01_16575, partial [Polyangiaceae bacterium]
GRILDATTGDPVSSKLKIVFNVYADAKGGTALWTEEQNITLDDGYFSAQLGSVTAIPPTLFDGTVRYLGVTVGADAEMAPREAITSVPYAFNAAVADVASSAAFTSLTGIPTVCDPGTYLSGFSALGVKQCVAIPKLECTTRYTASTAGLLTNSVGCDATSPYTVQVGGGCQANQPLTGSYPDICPGYPVGSGSVGPTAVGPGGGVVIIQNPCLILIGGTGYTGNWTCNTAVSASIRAWATCCKPQ